jgi:ATP-dependent DNA helicase RecG
VSCCAVELGIATFGDLLRHFPFRHVDRSLFHAVREAKEDEQVQLRGSLSGVKTVGEKQGRRLVARLTDATGGIELVWFKGIRWLQPVLKEGQEYIVFGKVSRFREHLNIAHPEIESAATWDAGIDATLQPVYSTTEKAAAKGLNSRGLGRLTETLLQRPDFHLTETLPSALVHQLGGLSREEAFRQLHAPRDQRLLDSATRRLTFEELFFIQLQLLRQKQLQQQSVRGQRFEHVGSLLNAFYNEHLPFTLTEAQKRVVKEIRKDMGSGKQMNRLLQGDRGQRENARGPAQHAHRARQRLPGGADGAY